MNEIFDLFANLDATDAQLDFPVLYGSGRDGWMAADPKGPKTDLTPLFEAGNVGVVVEGKTVVGIVSKIDAIEFLAKRLS